MAHRAEGLNDIFEHDVIIRENLYANAGNIEETPTQNKSIANKKYVDDQITATAYTDADAVNAVAVADDYLLNNGDTGAGNYRLTGQILKGGVSSVSAMGGWEVSTNQLIHCKMNDNLATTNVIDSEGNYNGTAVRNTSLMSAAGKINTSLDFNGTTDGVTFGDVPEIDSATKLSVSCWVYNDATSDDSAILSKWASGGAGGFYLFRDDVSASSGRTDIYSIIVSDGTHQVTLETPTNSATAGAWRFIVATIDLDANELRLYVNGAETADSPKDISAVTDIDAGTTPALIGSVVTTGSSCMDGKIDEVRIHTGRILSQAEITALYNSGNGTEADASVASDNIHATGSSSALVSTYLTDSKDNQLIEGDLEVQGDIYGATLNAGDGFTGTGAYTNFTIVNGIITNAS